VLDQTIAAARRLGRTLELLDPHPDVDTAADLRAVDLKRAPATAAALRAAETAPAPEAAPKVIDRAIDHESPWRRLVTDQLDTGQTYTYLETPAAVWIVPVSSDGDTVLVRQYRHPIGWHPLEAPAGSIEPGENPDHAARRELAEEAGGIVHGQLRRIGGFYSSSAHLTLRGLVYLATDVSFETPTHAGREGIQLIRIPLSNAIELARSGDICEAQTALALRYAAEAGAGA
jgi:ADP-ribose pyrophosphatase